MSSITTKELHLQTSAVLDLVEKGESFEITRNGLVIGRLQPIENRVASSWQEIMADVWEAQKNCKVKTSNPVLEERRRRRR